MTKPLSLFIRPPYDTWNLICSYGQDLPLDFAGTPNQLSIHAHLETTSDNARVYAAASGYLSTHLPEEIYNTTAELFPPDLTTREPDTITLCLEPIFVNLLPGFKQRLHGITADDENISLSLDFSPANEDTIKGFVYLNVDTQALKEDIGDLVSNMILPPAVTSQEREEAWRHFLNGSISIFVEGGTQLGKAGSPYLTPGSIATRHVGFTVLTQEGVHDPAHFYDWMRDFVMEEVYIDQFLSLVPKKWPLIDPNLSDYDAIENTKNTLYPYSVLQQLHQRRKLTAVQWREIGDNQKALYRRRLLQRVGMAPTSGSDPPFEFNDEDWRNIFQLEAIVEFYANFDEPWSFIPPQDPSIHIDFLPLSGNSATIAENEIILDGDPSLEKIWVGRDTISFGDDIMSTYKRYRIINIDQDTSRLILDENPSPATEISWRIHHRPILVLIDSFGGRIRGSKAIMENSSNSKVKLYKPDGISNYQFKKQIKKINKNFDTIYFHVDTSSRRAYRIKEVIDETEGIIELYGQPQFNGAESTWEIPAGVGGKLPKFDYNLGKNKIRGWDHYDGVLFIVDNGVVHERFIWSSYTSHKDTDTLNRNIDTGSSVKGNRKYFISSYISSSNFKNYSFKVVDDNAFLTGLNATIIRSWKIAGKWRTKVNLGEISNTSRHKLEFIGDLIFLYNDKERPITPYNIIFKNTAEPSVTVRGKPNFNDQTSSWRIQLYDGVREARYYFENNVEEDQALPNEEPNVKGKRLIRLHQGSQGSNTNQTSGSGSLGCLVSPLYCDMRTYLIWLYLEEYSLTSGDAHIDLEVDKIFGLNIHKSKKHWENNLLLRKNWNEKIVGTLWLIRPDERPKE